MRIMKNNTVVMFVSAFLVSCASIHEKADWYAAQGEWIKVVTEYRLAYRENPDDIEIKSKLIQAENKAAEFYYARGEDHLGKGEVEFAIAQFQRGLVAKPKHEKLIKILEVAMARQEAKYLYNEGISNIRAGELSAAEYVLKQALDIYPDNPEVMRVLKEVKIRLQESRSTSFILKSNKPITLNFRNIKLRKAFEFIAKYFGVNVIFDNDVKDSKITLFAKNVTFEQGIDLILKTSNTFYKKMGANTMLVAPDTKDKRGQYEDHIIRTFHLRSIGAKEMSNIIKGVVSTKKIIINEQMNSIMVRDKQDILNLIEKLVVINDRKPAEVLLEVEILEVNRNKAEQIGLDYGSVITAKFDEYKLNESSFSKTIRAGTVTLPNVTFRYFKQDVDAKTLANPKIRVLNSKSAKIHIGDRVPLRSSTIQDATGQTRTTFEYTDIGIRLQVEPRIHFDNSVTVKMNLEVSSLGQNLGTPSEPTFSIGTRNAETIMLLRDGETAVLGGLIRDEDRDNVVKIPGLGDIPILGALFRTTDNSSARTDVLLTITPKIIRATDISPRSMHAIYSGTAENYSSKPLFGLFNTDNNKKRQPYLKVGRTSSQASQANTVKTNGAPQNLPVLSFSKPMYQIEKGEEIRIAITGENLTDLSSLPVGILYNPDLIKYVRSENHGKIKSKVTVDEKKGMIKFDAKLNGGVSSKGKGVVGYVVMKGVKKGVSYFTYRTPSVKTATGEKIDVQVRASRIVIK